VSRYAIICGSGRFPILALEQARKLGDETVAVGIEGEASREIEGLAMRAHWVKISQLGKLIDTLHEEKITEAMLCGQVKHVSIFSSLRPDWRLAKLLFSLPQRNTEALIGGVVQELESEGIRLVDSTVLLKPLLAGVGTLSRRTPNADEEADIAYGRKIAAALSGFDLGQSVAVCERACVALEAMEGTDAMLHRAASLVNGRRLTLVKGSRRRKHMLFDVPVAGPGTISVMKETGATALAVDGERTLLLDREEMIGAADEAQIAIAGYPPPED
jgi:UDP-2,3-diacylglucosamine hydrolase